MVRRFIYLAISLVAALLVIGCERQQPSDNSATSTGDTKAPVSLNVMTFNIEWGGKHVSFENVVEAIRRSGTDIVGVQEAEGNLQELAAALDWNFDERNYVISRFQLIDPPAAQGKYVFVELRPGEVVALANVHLPSDPYGPDLLRAGASVSAIIANEHRVRMPMLNAYLERLADLVDTGVPTFVTGDFNSPTHTDRRAHSGGSKQYPNSSVDWPASLAMEKAGFRDSWREVYPDAAAQPGLTWWAARPPLEAYAPGEDDPQDRIDMIWSNGPTTARTAMLVGETNGPGVSMSVEPWPSDHRGVVIAFDVEPSELPGLLSTDRRVYKERDRPRVIYKFTGAAAGAIAVTDLDADQVMETYSVDLPRGTIDLPPLAAGHYAAKAELGGKSYAREFWVLAEGAIPRIEVAQRVFAADEPVLVHWENAPGYRNDYVALYAADSARDNRKMLGYAYVDALPDGELDLRTGIGAIDGALEPGRYIAKLMKDDGYEALAETGQFEVR